MKSRLLLLGRHQRRLHGRPHGAADGGGSGGKTDVCRGRDEAGTVKVPRG